jgi:hypothetical protein
LLVWFPQNKEFFNVLPPRTRQPYEANQTPLSFGKKPANNEIENGWQNGSLDVISPKKPSKKSSEESKIEEPSKEEKPNEPESSEPASENLGNAFSIQRFSLGLSATYAILETKRGDRFTDQPPLLLNGALGYFEARVLNEYRSIGEINFRSYSGGDVTGDETTLYASVFVLHLSRSNTDALLLGGTLGMHFGNVKSRFAKKDLFYASLFATLLYDTQLTQIGMLQSQVSLAPFDLLAGDFHGRLRFDLWPAAFLPKQLGFFGAARKGPVQWSAFEFGLHWNLL